MNQFNTATIKGSSGLLTLIFFTAVFALTIFFFVIVLLINKGPIDQAEGELPAPFTSDEKIQRDQLWRNSTPDFFKQGQKLFDIHVFGDVQPLFDLIQQGKYGSTEVELYKVLTYGIPGTALKTGDYLPKSVRWKIVHYIRSQMPNPQSSTASQWASLEKEGI